MRLLPRRDLCIGIGAPQISLWVASTTTTKDRVWCWHNQWGTALRSSHYPALIVVTCSLRETAGISPRCGRPRGAPRAVTPDAELSATTQSWNLATEDEGLNRESSASPYVGAAKPCIKDTAHPDVGAARLWTKGRAHPDVRAARTWTKVTTWDNTNQEAYTWV